MKLAAVFLGNPETVYVAGTWSRTSSQRIPSFDRQSGGPLNRTDGSVVGQIIFRSAKYDVEQRGRG